MTCSKVTEHKTNTQKSIAFPYISDRQQEIKIKTIISFTVVPKDMMYWGICLTKYVPYLHAENSKEKKIQLEGHTMFMNFKSPHY